MKEIKLSGKRGAGKVALVDDEDFERVNAHKWYWNAGYARTAICGQKIMMHRFILNFPPCQLDHRNRTRLDNQKSNLRPADPFQQSQNRDLVPSRNKSGVIGVWWLPKRQRWHWQIRMCGKKYAGDCNTFEQAIRKRDARARRLHGEFAVLNRPLDYDYEQLCLYSVP